MFTIDLLKGKALPVKIDFQKSILKAVPILIPILAITAFAAVYQHDKGVLQIHKNTLDQQQKQLEQYSKEVAEYNVANKRIKDMEKCLNDISKALSYRIQVSDMLTALVQPLPESIFVHEIRMNRNTQMEKDEPDESGNVKNRLVVKRNLKLVLCGYDAGGSDLSVQQYIKKLEQSPTLSEIFAEIKSSARRQGLVDDKDAIFYEIECVLREQR